MSKGEGAAPTYSLEQGPARGAWPVGRAARAVQHPPHLLSQRRPLVQELLPPWVPAATSSRTIWKTSGS